MISVEVEKYNVWAGSHDGYNGVLSARCHEHTGGVSMCNSKAPDQRDTQNRCFQCCAQCLLIAGDTCCLACEHICESVRAYMASEEGQNRLRERGE